MNGRKTGGRKAGTPNKATAEIRDLARDYCPGVSKELAQLALEAQSEKARVAAIKEILDRTYGRASQPLDGDGQGGPAQAAKDTQEERQMTCR